jgi:hypothetical protein
MTRLARRALLLVTFSLLAWAAMASAEYAWVIWGAYEDENPRSTPVREIPPDDGVSTQRRDRL